MNTPHDPLTTCPACGVSGANFIYGPIVPNEANPDIVTQTMACTDCNFSWLNDFKYQTSRKTTETFEEIYYEARDIQFSIVAWNDDDIVEAIAADIEQCAIGCTENEESTRKARELLKEFGPAIRKSGERIIAEQMIETGWLSLTEVITGVIPDDRRKL